MNANRKAGTIGGLDASLWVGRIIRSYHDGRGKTGHCIMARLHSIDRKRGIATITPTNHGHTEDVSIENLYPSWPNNQDLHQLKLKLKEKAARKAARTSMEAAFQKAEAAEPAKLNPLVSTQRTPIPSQPVYFEIKEQPAVADPDPLDQTDWSAMGEAIEQSQADQAKTTPSTYPPMGTPVITTSHTEALPEVRFTLNRVSASSLRAVLEKIEALPRMEQDVRAAQAILIDHHEKYLSAKKELSELGVVFEAEPTETKKEAPVVTVKPPVTRMAMGQLQEKLQHWFRTSTIGFEQDGAKVSKALGINYGPRQTIEVAMAKGKLPAGSVVFGMKSRTTGRDTLTVTRVK